MLTEADFEHAYGPLLQKWEAKIGKAQVTELVADISPAIQGLMVKTADHQKRAGAADSHTKIVHDGIATYEAFRKKHGH